MDVREWAKSTADYGHELVNSGFEGARSGGDAFLNGEPVAPFLSESLQKALKPAVLGVCLGVLGSYPGSGKKSIGRTLAFGLLGGVIGFGAGVAWESRRFTASVAGGALRSLGKTRDEHWWSRHPIDYA